MKIYLISVLLIAALIISGCSSGTGNAVQPNPSDKGSVKEFYMESMSFNTSFSGNFSGNRSFGNRTSNRSFENRTFEMPPSRQSGRQFNRSSDGMHPQFSLREIVVNKGDTVKLKINTTNGEHDFNLDDFNIHASTPTGKTTEVDFVADKTGEFIYYCSMPGHREAGQWGTLRVV